MYRMHLSDRTFVRGIFPNSILSNRLRFTTHSTQEKVYAIEFYGDSLAFYAMEVAGTNDVNTMAVGAGPCVHTIMARRCINDAAVFQYK